MFSKVLLVHLYICLHISFIQAQNFDQLKDAERKLVTVYQQMHANYQSSFTKAENLNDHFADTFVEIIRKNDSSFDYEFSLLQDSAGVSVYKSEDGRLKAYSWNKVPYTSMVEAYTLFQYHTKGAYSVTFAKNRFGNIESKVSELNRIHTFSVGQKSYYFLVKNTILSSDDMTQTISCHVLSEKGTLQEVPIFKTKTKLLSSISYNFRKTTLKDDRDILHLLEVDIRNKEIKIPLINTSSQITTSYLSYKFKDGYFHYEGISR